jgi:hypothetical protein
VVSGVPRSGTSLVMQMLAAGGFPVLSDGARAPDAHNPRGYLEYQPVKRLREDASWLGAARGRAVKVVHSLVDALPEGFDYRLVLLRRDLEEVVASQDAMLDADAPPGLAPGRLRQVFCSQLVELERWLGSRPQFRLLRVEHRDLLAAPARAAAALDWFLGGGLDVEAMAGAVDPSLHRQRR